MDLEYGLGFAMEEGLALALDLIEERRMESGGSSGCCWGGGGLWSLGGVVET